MSRAREPRRPVTWRKTTSLVDVITFCVTGICVLSAAGLGPRIISVMGLIILLSLPAILMVVYIWFPAAADRLTGACRRIARSANDRIEKIRDTTAEARGQKNFGTKTGRKPARHQGRI